MLKKLYDWTIALSKTKHAPYALAAVSFAESSFFPIPPDVVLVPMALAQPKKAWFFALICTIASVIGGLVGYAIGHFLYDTVGQWLIGLYGYGAKIEHLRALYQEYGHWVILIKGLTPIPFKLVTIASGIFEYNLFWFIVLSFITRAGRFFLVAGILNRFGGPIGHMIETRPRLILCGFVFFIVAGFMAIKLFI